MRYKILSIDDSKSVHAYLDTCFSKNTYELVHVLSAAEGIDLLLSSAASFSLVLLDWEMPEMSGPEALVKMRNLGLSLPIIMVTTKNDPNEIIDILNKGANEYVMKPFTPDIILEKVHNIILEAGVKC